MADAGQYDSLYDEAGYKYNVDPLRIKAHAIQETGEDPTRTGGKGEWGMMQFMPDTAARLGLSRADAYQPEPAIDTAARLIALNDAAHTDASGKTDLMASTAAYNGSGPAAADYAQKVRAIHGQLTAAGGLKLPDKGAAQDDPFAKTLHGAPAPPAKAAEPAPAASTDGDPFAATLKSPPPSAGETGFGSEPPGSAKAGDWGIPGQPSAAAPHPLAPPATVGERVGNWIGDTAKSVGNAITGAYAATPNMLAPSAQAAVEGVPVVGPALGAAARVPGAVLGGAGALFAGTQAGVAAAGNAVSPGLGRDLAAGMEVVPAAQAAHPLMPGAAAIVRERMADNARYTAAPLSPEFKANPLALTADRPGATLPQGDISANPNVAPRSGPAVVPSGQTQSVGAAASREGTPAGVLTEKTRGQEIRDLEHAVNQTAEERAGPQMQDHTPYVEGIPPRTLAARDFSTSVNALDEKIAKGKDPEFRDAIDKNARDRNEGMVDLLRRDAQDAIAVERAHETRAEVSPEALGVFKNEQPVDGSGLIGKVQEYLKGPDGKQAAVRNTLDSVLKSLHDADGKPESLPSQIYGARKNLTDLLKKGVKGTSDLADDVRASKHILAALVPEFDKTISEGAPKFSTDYLPQYHERSQPINQMEFLQKYQTGAKKLTNDQGYLQPHKVQTMLDDILQGRKASGVNGAKSLTEAQIQNIINVRNELAAQGLQDRLASVRGSDTFQQINRPGVLGRGPVGGALKALGEAALAIPTGGVGNFVYHYGIKPGMEVRRQNRIAGLEAARKQELLAPPPRNWLNPP